MARSGDPATCFASSLLQNLARAARLVESRELAAISSSTMDARPLKRIDVMRHELKALRYMLDNFHSGKQDRSAFPAREDFCSGQTRALYDAIANAPDRATAEKRVAELELDEVDLQAFLSLSGEHYYAYPALVRQRAESIRRGELKLEAG